MHANPIIWADYPDLDVIRVEDTYYMVSTTMHMMPGCVILRSYDLIHWEVATHVYDRLDDTPAQRLEQGRQIYSKGMWAASLRYHKHKFYVIFVANDTHKTYLYTADTISGPWAKQYVEGFYHDCSLFFDEDDRIYLVHGNAEIHLTELSSDLSGPKPGGVLRMIVKEKEPYFLGYEGAHFHKINGKYYVFLIHISQATGRRTQACYMADSLEGEFVGGEVFNDDMGYFNSGVAQGGIVDTPDGDWYAMLFQDHGAVGRIPVLVPLHFENDIPVFPTEAPKEIVVPSTRPDHVYKPLIGSDDFHYEANAEGKVRLKDVWQWNHTPNDALWSVTDQPGVYRIQTAHISPNLTFAVNTLTQRAMGPACEAIVTLDGSRLEDGDYGGLCFLIGTYGLIALTKTEGQFYLVMLARNSEDSSIFGNLVDTEPATEYARIPVSGSVVTLKAFGNFVNNQDDCTFSYLEGIEWKPLGISHKMIYKLDHFMGCRIGLFLYSTRVTGSSADFSNFKYDVIVSEDENKHA
ncbi:glycoside hydrolase family 43 protein [Paenibacillus sp. AD87]|uniref:glycoside hydrolase family 43 protein n=1 Tax=Paenibacillus sp. AD87 TaxID=1528787 RepID=UPI0007E4D185|nr:glycoside hydrolase 43 family protein [Paenibacillus sp. AD87]OAX48447.1 Non-reducing end alpha-L-arabinofuranosidase BoGH43B [Paenibacillus sp. AD87]